MSARAKHSPAPQRLSLPARAIVLGGGFLYIALAVAITASRGGGGTIGDLCAGNCARVTLLGIDLALWGIGAMGSTVALALLAGRGRHIATAAVAMALLDGGASLALAASQWIGAAPLCPLCQACAAVALMVSGTVVWGLSPALPRPRLLIPIALLAGILAIPLAWPRLQGLPAAQLPDSPAPTTSAPSPTITHSPFPVPHSPSVYTLTVITDFSCSVCERFERRVLPGLNERALAPGIVKLVPVFGATTAMSDDTRRRTIIALAAERAGVSPAIYLPLIRGSAATTLRNPAALGWPDPATAARVAEEVAAGYRTGAWDRELAVHRARGAELRRLYFTGRNGTPSFIMTRPGQSPEQAAASKDAYAFHGYQIGKPFLEFAGIGEVGRGSE